MKKLTYLLLMLGLSVAASAQISIGAKGGLNFATFGGKDVEGYKTRVSIHVGGYAQVPLKGAWSLQPEMYLSMQGANWEGKGDDKTISSYLQIPVLVKYTTRSGFFGETGPQIGFLLKATDKVDGVKEDIQDIVKKTDFSWGFGAGYRFNEKLSAYARYNLSLSNFWQDEKNRVMQVGVSYALFTTGQ
ncbi:porin family protein [Paraflavitalea sp. CAU 1676]|uniref:porin family protein n=1 Tax=Paraflavitalea sp. CAU 1676 TaxID=3032598 RepID=UPI0023D9A804|nr:porin family protein [Paraflavitalea sp. CAU 1676]MDF2190477.1 porin family protein [Paraflavitalea sp. CAU 1676]